MLILDCSFAAAAFLTMFRAWSRLSREQKRAWGLVSGAIVAGTVMKVSESEAKNEQNSVECSKCCHDRRVFDVTTPSPSFLMLKV